MKYGLFKRRWSLKLRSPGLAEWTVAWMVKLRALLHCGCRDWDNRCGCCCLSHAVKFPLLLLSNSIMYEIQRLQQWHTLDPHAKHYSKVIKGS